MKKYFLVILCLFLLTGCDVTYNLEIGDNYKEEAVISGDYSSYNYNLYNHYSNKPIPLSKLNPIQPESNDKLDGINYYNKKDLSNAEIINLVFNGKFNNDIENSTILSFGVGDVSVIDKDNKINISVPTDFKAFKQFKDLESVTINIKSKLKVKSHNADKVKGNTYTWIVSRENYNKDQIEMVLNKKGIINFSNNPMTSFTISLISIVSVCFIIFLIVRRRYKNKNSL